MIPLLLWRCPLCATNDALTHTARWPRRDRVNCAHCHARWQVRRAVGDNFYLELTSAAPPVERSITAWYDEMKKGLHLAEIRDPQSDLGPGEPLYLASRPAELWLGPESPAGGGESEGVGTLASRGRLFLTGRRLLWMGDTHRAFPLESITRASTILTLGMAVSCGRELFFFRFLGESPLKWVTYLSLVGAQTGAGRRLATSHF